MEEARPLWNLLNNQIPKAFKILYAAIRGPRSEIPHTLTVPYSSLSTFLFLINSSYILHRLILKLFGCSTVRLRIQFLPAKRSGVGVGVGVSSRDLARDSRKQIPPCVAVDTARSDATCAVHTAVLWEVRVKTTL